jgi:AraC-like DNA-binding protein
VTQVSGRGFHRAGYATGDAAEGHDYLRALYTDFDVTIDGTTDEFQLRSDVLQFGAAAISRLRHSMAVTMFPRDGLGWPGIFQIRYPTLKIEVGHRDFRLGAGDAIAVRQHEPYRAAWNTLDADVTMLDPAMITDVAAEITGRTSPVTFEFATAVSPLAAAHWHQTVTLVQRVALANAAHTNGALLADDLSRLLTTTALTCFRNGTMTDAILPPTRTSPASLRRAIAYIDANLDTPIRLADLAAAARVSPRALNVTFNRYHGLSPIGYVHRARLDRAHHDLRSAQPGDGESVTGIAARWGFSSLPRFGVYYRRVYGQPPSHTLRKT